MGPNPTVVLTGSDPGKQFTNMRRDVPAVFQQLTLLTVWTVGTRHNQTEVAQSRKKSTPPDRLVLLVLLAVRAHRPCGINTCQLLATTLRSIAAAVRSFPRLQPCLMLALWLALRYR